MIIDSASALVKGEQQTRHCGQDATIWCASFTHLQLSLVQPIGSLFSCGGRLNVRACPVFPTIDVNHIQLLRRGVAGLRR